MFFLRKKSFHQFDWGLPPLPPTKVFMGWAGLGRKDCWRILALIFPRSSPYAWTSAHVQPICKLHIHVCAKSVGLGWFLSFERSRLANLTIRTVNRHINTSEVQPIVGQAWVIPRLAWPMSSPSVCKPLILSSRLSPHFPYEILLWAPHNVKKLWACLAWWKWKEITPKYMLTF